MASNVELGKGFEYACLTAFVNVLEKEGKDARIVTSSAYETTKECFEKLPESTQMNYMLAAQKAVDMILPLEPQIEHGQNTLLFSINADGAGTEGDVRDVLMVRSKTNNKKTWEIGLSCKHNHEALKHPRINRNVDFGTAWIGYACGDDFIKKMNDIVADLEQMKEEGVLWRDIEDKEQKYYIPILNAYMQEIERLCEVHPDAPKRLLLYFFGLRDFYKVIAVERTRMTKLEPFNISGTLNMSAGKIKPMATVAKLPMPTELLDIRLASTNGIPSTNKFIVTFDDGWAISMRIHNKDKMVKPGGLAWDVQLVGVAREMLPQIRFWDL